MFALAATASLAPASIPARVLGFADEFRFNLSRAGFPAGRVVLQLKNIGEDDHDLRIIGPRGAPRAETGTVKPGDLGEIRTTLARGRYTYLCTVADHAARGMRGSFVVTARKRGKR
jgi:plastocyanin